MRHPTTHATTRSTLVVSLFLAITLLLGLAAVPKAEARPSDYGYRYATSSQKKVLKRVASNRISAQSGWFMSNNRHGLAVVCGNNNHHSLPGGYFLKSSGSWRYLEPKSSRDMQILTGLCG